MSPHDTKKCSACHQIFPSPRENFHKDKTKKDGLASTCKECAKARAKKHSPKSIAKHREKMNTDPEYREKYNEWARNRRKDPIHGERIRNRDRKHTAQRNPEKRRAYFRGYYEKNKERLIAAQKQRNAENPQASHDRVTKWNKNNPEKRRMLSRVNRANRRAMQSIGGSYTAKEIQGLYEEQEGLCAYCGIRLFDEYQVDHYIPLTKGGGNTIDNLLCACETCNKSKGNKMPEEWIAERNSHVKI